MMLKETAVNEIVAKLQQEFPSFGGIRKGDGWNPIAHAMEGKPAQFAAGVEIAPVVRAVARELGRMLYLPEEEQDAQPRRPDAPALDVQDALDVHASYSTKCKDCQKQVRKGQPCVWQRSVGLWCNRVCYNRWRDRVGV